jgi:GTP cyclohydrolase I
MEIAMDLQVINGNGSKTMTKFDKKFDKANLPDVQATEDTRGIEISRVGVEGVHYPLTIKRKNDGKIQVLAEFNMFGSLTKHLKGTNMSRPVELLMEQGEHTISGNTFPPFLELLSKKLGAEDVYVSAAFDYWINRTSPVSKKVFPLKYDCKFIGQIYKGKVTFVVEASVPITTVCPCSKEMSLTDKEEGIGRGAHNQRGIVTLQVVTDPVSPGVWIEDLVEIAEASGSAPLYALLKRPDEKFVTEQAYDNPRFVEDVAREAALGVHKIENASWFKVRVRNYEAIHNHQATAYVCQKKINNEWTTDSRAFF